MRTPSPAWWWWPNSERVTGARAVLFFPPAGSEPASARPLLSQAGGLQFGVLQLPGRGTRHEEPAPTSLEVLVEAIAGSIARLGGPPPVLVGHSFGGLLAYAVVVALERTESPVGALTVIASVSPSAFRADLAADGVRFGEQGRAGFVARRTERILRAGGVAPQLQEHAEFAERARTLVEVDVSLSYDGFPVRPVRCPVTSITARADTWLAPGAADDWPSVSAGTFRRWEVAGDHFFYRDAPERLMSYLRLEVAALDGDYGLT